MKLSDDIDPCASSRTELRLDRAASFVPPSDSFWPPETALASRSAAAQLPLAAGAPRSC